MSEDTKPDEATEPDQEQAANQESLNTDQEQDEQQPEETKNAEAARYRRRLRETEAERDRLATQVDALRTAAVDDEVKAKGIQPAAFWAAGNTLADLLDDDGALDPDKIEAGVKNAVETLGLSRHRAPYVPREGRVTDPEGSVTSWESAFRR